LPSSLYLIFFVFIVTFVSCFKKSISFFSSSFTCHFIPSFFLFISFFHILNPVLLVSLSSSFFHL
jgi:hypothetical protein